MFAGVMLRGTRASRDDYTHAQTLLDALTPFRQADVTGSWSDETTLIVQALTWNTEESRHEQAPEICRETGRVIASWVRLDNRAALCSALGLEAGSTLTDPQLILAAHRAWGRDCADRLEGDFSFVIYDPQTAETFCARDSIGAMPFFYYLDRDVFVFATTAHVFPLIRRLGISPSDEWMARYIAGVSGSFTKTAFEGVHRLAPAYHMTVNREVEAAPSRYFRFEDTAPTTWERDDKWVDAWRDGFHNAVEDRLRSSYLIGAESSGGLDSSTIVAHAAEKVWHGKADFHCFGVSHMEDEPACILETAMHCGIEQNHIITTPPYVRPEEIARRAITCLGYPPENGLASLYYRFFETAEKFGTRTLLSGFGGDEAATHQAGRLFAEMEAARAWPAMYRELPGNAPMRAARTLRAMARSIGAGESGGGPSGAGVPPTPLNPDAAEAHGIRELMGRAMSRGDISAGVNARVLERLVDPLHGGLLTGRLEGCQLMANSYGIAYRWPLLERRLIQQYLATPSIEKRRGAMGRYLHRRACRGTVPDSTLWKQEKSLGAITQRQRQQRKAEPVALEDMPERLHHLLDTRQYRNQHQRMQTYLEGAEKVSDAEVMAFMQTARRVTDLNIFLRMSG